jgi:hypothetical protein
MRRSISTHYVIASFVFAAACSSRSDGTAQGDAGPLGEGGGNVSASGGNVGTSTGGANGGSIDASGGSGTSSGGARSSSGGSSSTGGTTGSGDCVVTESQVRITEVDVGATVVSNEDEAGLMPIALSPMPGGGSRLAWMGSDSKVHITTLDVNDAVTGAPFALPAKDFGDLYADDKGGVLLLTRDAQGGGTLNCGDPTNLCGTPPSPPIACYDMYMVRFDGSAESWATKLTDSSAALPPYSTSKTGAAVKMIWWYAHHGRIVSDGTNFAGYFGTAESISQNGCINIHQGDRMKVVNPAGAIQSGGFDWGCSHSGYERILWDDAQKKYLTVCKNDLPTSGESGKIAFAPSASAIYPVDLYYSNVGNLVAGANGGYWLTVSNSRTGQPANKDGLADVHLLHFTTSTPDRDVVLASDTGLNDRAPHLAAWGNTRMIAAWETSTAAGDLDPNDKNRKLYVQAVDGTLGSVHSTPLLVNVKGNRYQDFKSYPDGSVAYAAPGTAPTKIQILRVLP